MQLDPAATAAGVRLLSHDTVGSTNAEALQFARKGERGPLWVTAKRQTAGRGRRGRSWVSEPGNLYASLLLTDPAPPERFPELSFVAALALHDAIGGRIPGLSNRLVLKWPNDLLIDRNKFAGIPPLAGFFAKYYVFLGAIKAGLYGLAVIGVLASVVGAYYYLVIVKIMYFDEPAKSFVPVPGALKAVLAVAGLFNLLYFVYPAPLIDAAGLAAKSLF